MANIAETVKKQTDRILRQRALNQTEGVVVSGVSSGTGAPAPTVNNPQVDLAAHKASTDHDGRYYTESEIDGMLTFVSLSDTPAAYTGEGGKIIAVKSDVSGLEFVSAPAAANGVPAGGTTNQLLAKDGATDYVVKWMDAPAAANGLPAGGTAGQVLEKIDSTDYNTQWATPSGGGASYQNPIDEPPASPSMWDDEFNDNAVASAWNWLNQGVSSANEADTYLQIDSVGLSGDNLRGLAKPCPSGNFTILAKIIGSTRLGNYPKSGVLIAESLVGKQFLAAARYVSFVNTRIEHELYTTPSARSFVSSQSTINVLPIYIKIYVYNDSGWKVNISYSSNGIVWFNHAIGVSLGFTPAYIGLGANNAGTTNVDSFYFDWFRVIED